MGGRIAVTGISLSAGLLMVGGMAVSAKNASSSNEPVPVITRRVVVVPAPNAVPATTPVGTFPATSVPADTGTGTGTATTVTAVPAATTPAPPVTTAPPAPPPPPTTASAGS